jgi:hypothetical protein
MNFSIQADKEVRASERIRIVRKLDLMDEQRRIMWLRIKLGGYIIMGVDGIDDRIQGKWNDPTLMATLHMVL